MRLFANVAFSAVLAGGAVAIGDASPAVAQISLSIGIGNGDYDYYRSCSWYRHHDFPAPRRCYRYFQGIFGSDVFVDGDFIFRDHDDFDRWHDRDDYRHWRNHEFRHQDWARGDQGDRGNRHDFGDRRDNGDRGNYGDHRDNGNHGDHGDRGDHHGDHGDHWDNNGH